jgi:hypothetical protein
MEILYHPHEFLATGGAIGDVLFFFCSGFTLFMGRMDRFDNWYKRRINRIYPSVFAWAILSSFFFNCHYDMKYTIIYGGGWFVSCIMIYYVLLYFIQRFMVHHLKSAFIIASLVVVVWYYFDNQSIGYNMYGKGYFRWCHYFLFMLLGAIIGISKKDWKFKFRFDFLKFIICLFSYYILLWLRKYPVFESLQVVTLLPLLGITFYFYKLCNSDTVLKIYENKIVHYVVFFIASLCLEIYLVQYVLLTDKMNYLFPLNLFIMFLIVVVVAYILKVLSRVFAQTFKESNYDWKQVFNIE